MDDFIKFHGAAAFEAILNGSENQMDFRMDAVAAKYDLRDDEQRIAYAGEISQLIAALPNAVEREVYAGRAAERAGISREAMLLDVYKRQAVLVAPSHAAVMPSTWSNSSGETKVVPSSICIVLS